MSSSIKIYYEYGLGDLLTDQVVAASLDLDDLDDTWIKIDTIEWMGNDLAKCLEKISQLPESKQLYKVVFRRTKQHRHISQPAIYLTYPFPKVGVTEKDRAELQAQKQQIVALDSQAQNADDFFKRLDKIRLNHLLDYRKQMGTPLKTMSEKQTPLNTSSSQERKLAQRMAYLQRLSSQPYYTRGLNTGSPYASSALAN